MAAERNGQRKRPAQSWQHRLDRVLRRKPGLDLFGHQVCDDFGIGFAFKGAPARDQFFAQRTEILDDPVVHQRDFAGGVGVGVVGGGRAVRGPAGVRDADGAWRGMARQFDHQIVKLALGATADQFTRFDGADPRAVVSTIFHAAQAVDQPVCHLILADDPDNSAHGDLPSTDKGRDEMIGEPPGAARSSDGMAQSN